MGHFEHIVITLNPHNCYIYSLLLHTESHSVVYFLIHLVFKADIECNLKCHYLINALRYVESKYSRTCYEQPLLQNRKSCLLTQVAPHRRFICIQNAILGKDQVASHRRLAAGSRFYCTGA